MRYAQLAFISSTNIHNSIIKVRIWQQTTEQLISTEQRQGMSVV
jgi:hypothetical protein